MGQPNVNAMLRHLTSAQFMEWVHYAELEPFDETRADYRAAMVATILAEVNRDPKKRALPYSTKDFMPVFDAEPTKKTPWQKLKAIGSFIVEAYK